MNDLSELKASLEGDLEGTRVYCTMLLGSADRALPKCVLYTNPKNRAFSMKSWPFIRIFSCVLHIYKQFWCILRILLAFKQHFFINLFDFGAKIMIFAIFSGFFLPKFAYFYQIHSTSRVQWKPLPKMDSACKITP